MSNPEKYRMNFCHKCLGLNKTFDMKNSRENPPDLKGELIKKREVILKRRIKMWKIITLAILFILASTGCQGSLLLVDTHPDLNRRFRPGIDTPGEYPY